MKLLINLYVLRVLAHFPVQSIMQQTKQSNMSKCLEVTETMLLSEALDIISTSSFV